MSIEIRVNGSKQAYEDRNVTALLTARGVDSSRKGIAIAVNGTVVPRGQWNEITLNEGDEVEIIRALSGG